MSDPAVADKASTHIAHRDVSLDIIRVVALILMLSVHWGRSVPPDAISIKLLRAIGELAPAFFFYAFGMTFERYLKKPLSWRVEQNLLLLAIGIVHSLMLEGSPFTSEFFLFFAASRAVLDVFLHAPGINRYVIALGACILGVLWLLSPSSTYDLLKASNPGPFPVFPWILFVLAGYWHEKQRNNLAAIWVALLAVAVGGAIWLGGMGSPTKWPLSPSYFLITSGGVAIFIFLFDAIHWKKLSQTLEMLSKNLLLATILHYPVVWMLTLVHKQLIRHIEVHWQALEYLILSSVGVMMLLGLVFITLRIFASIEHRAISSTLLAAAPSVAFIGIIAYGALSEVFDTRVTGLIEIILMLLIYWPMTRSRQNRAAATYLPPIVGVGSRQTAGERAPALG